MQLSPLQSRLAVSLAASLFVLGLYWFLCSPVIALAAELPLQPQRNPEGDFSHSIDGLESLFPEYEPDFGLFDRSVIGRAASEAVSLSLKTPTPMNVNPGGSVCFVLSKSDISSADSSKHRRQSDEGEEGDASGGDTAWRDDHFDIGGNHDPSDTERIRRASDQTTVYISATTCLQPGLSGGGSDDDAPPQLKLLASTSSYGGCPTSTADLDEDMWTEFDEGLGTLSVNTSDSAVYITVLAPDPSDVYQGIYNVEVAASLDDYYYSYNEYIDDSNPLLWMDSDSSAALLVTQNLTYKHSDAQTIMNIDPPFELYVENDDWPAFKGIRRSRCGMENQALISANANNTGREQGLVRTSMTTRGAGGYPKQQFYFEGLNHSSTYRAVLVQVSNYGGSSSLGKRQDDGVGHDFKAFAPLEFRTLTGTTCKVITDLDFCTETQYAVPGNDKYNGSELAQMYDDYARKMYSNFEKIMMQIPCETDSTSKYSLVRDCSDCKDAYKRWLCTVAIPRCEDYSSSNKYAFVRDAGQPFPNGTFLPADTLETLSKVGAHNASRNSFIDERITPGPYKEILPCEEICYEVVQSCPAALGFTCPRPHMTAFHSSYAQRKENSATVECNYPGQPRTQVAGAGVALPPTLLYGALLVGLIALKFS